MSQAGRSLIYYRTPLILGGVGGALPSFVPLADGVPADLSLDFTSGQGWVSNTLSPLSSLLTVSRSGTFADGTTTGYGRDINGLWQPYTANTLRYDYSGSVQRLLVEETRTNLCLWSSDFTNAAWVKTSVTAAKTATGPDGVANSASTLTATGANGTALQTITSASAARVSDCFIKRRTGSGTINVTQDNGTTWTVVTVTSSWTLVSIPTQTTANPVVGIRIVTSGDAVDVAWFGHELGAYITLSGMLTDGSSKARSADNVSMATPAALQTTGPFSVLVDFDDSAFSSGVNRHLFTLRNSGSSNERATLVANTSNLQNAVVANAGTDSLSAGSPAITAGARNKSAMAYSSSNGNHTANGTAVGADDAVITLPASVLNELWIASFAGTTQYLNSGIRAISIWGSRISNTALVSLTT